MMKQQVDDGYFATGLVQPSKTPTETRRNPQKPRKVFSWLSTIFSYAKNPVQGKCKKAVVNTTRICVFFFFPHFWRTKTPRINNNQQQISNQWKHLPFFSDKQKYKAKSSIFLGVGFDGLEFFITLFSPGVIHWRLGLDTSVGKGVDRRPWKFPKRLVWMDSNKDLTPWKFNSSRRKNDGWKATLVLGR